MKRGRRGNALKDAVLTHEQIGERIGLSKQRVQAIEAAALRKLRAHLLTAEEAMTTSQLLDRVKGESPHALSFLMRESGLEPATFEAWLSDAPISPRAHEAIRAAVDVLDRKRATEPRRRGRAA
jgi:hypothetical protein